jgi:hypothetical protein
MRDGVPLPGLTPEQVVSQLAYRVLGPLRPDRVRWVLDYHGLAGRRATDPAGTARRNGITVGMVMVHAAKTRAAGAALPLRPGIVSAAMRPSADGEDHLARIRIARTLGLPTPSARKPVANSTVSPTQREIAAARAAIRILAATGPLDEPTLLAALARARRWKTSAAVTPAALTVALHAAGATRDTSGRWHAPPGAQVPDRYARIVAVGAGRDLSRRQMVDVLIAAGYSTSSAAGVMAGAHPLFTGAGPNRYRVVASRPRTPSDGRA